MKNLFILSLYLMLNTMGYCQCFWVKNQGIVNTSYIKASSGFLYRTGSFSGTIDFDPGAGVVNLTSAGGKDIYISKLDSLGNFVWAKRIGNTLNDESHSITFDNQQNILIVGNFEGVVDFNPNSGIANLTAGSTTSGTIAGYILKMDSDGNFINAVNLSTNNIGYSGFLSCTSVASDNIGNIFIGGKFQDAAGDDDINGNPTIVYYDFNPGNSISNLSSYDGVNFILKLNSNLGFVWVNNFGNVLYTQESKPEVSVSLNGNVYFTYIFTGGPYDFDPGIGISNLIASGSTDIFVIKFNQAGIFQWVKQLGSSNGYGEYSRDIKVDSNDNLVITGSFSGTVDFDPGSSVANYTALGYRDGFIWKLNSIGNLIFAKIISGSPTGQVEPYGLDIDNNSNIYYTGWNNVGSADFDPGPGSFLIPGGSGGGFISKLNNNGDFVWAKRFFGNGGCFGSDISYSVNGLYSTGFFNGTIDFDGSTGVFNMVSTSGTSNYYIHKVMDEITPTIYANGPTTFCSGGSVTLTSSSPSGNIWSNGATSQSITVATSGIYSLSVISGNCSSASSSTSVTVNPIPTTPIVSASGATTFCQGGSVTLSSSSATSNSWTTGETTQSITVSTSGTYSVSVVLNGCSSTSFATTVTVNSIPAIPTVSLSGPTTICQGDSVILTSSSATGNSWTTGETTQSITVSTSGTYSVSVVLNGCSSTSVTTTVTVNSIPAIPTVSLSGPTTICQGDSVILTSSASTGNIWSTEETTQAISVSTSGNFSVSVIANGCSSISDLISVTVNPIPPINVQPSDQNTNLGVEAYFVVSSSNSNANFQWQTDFGAGFQNLINTGQYSGTSNDTLIVANVTMNNNDQTFRCIVSSGSCSDTSFVAILTVNNVGVIEVERSNFFSVFPNPTQDLINVQVGAKLIGQNYSIFDKTGRLILFGELKSENTQIELRQLSCGIYLIKIGENVMQTCILIKE